MCQLEMYSSLLVGLASCSGPRGGYSVFTTPHSLSQSFLNGSVGKESACSAADMMIPGSGRSPEGGNGNPSSILAWKILWTEEPGGLQSMGYKQSDMTEYEHGQLDSLSQDATIE